VAHTANAAIRAAVRFLPDVILVNLNLPGISGKDLLVALNSQGIDTPIIMIAKKGMEADVIQAFRLGAADYLLWPAREAEVVSVVERILRQVREQREQENLASQLKLENEALQKQVRGLTATLAIGKAVTTLSKAGSSWNQLVEGSVYVAGANLGWLILRNQPSEGFLLCAQHNLPAKLAGRVGQPWEDDLSHLVGQSGETLSVHSTPLGRFKIAHLGKSVLAVPVKEKKQVIGVLVVMRTADHAFSPDQRTLLEALAGYAAISISNSRLLQGGQSQNRETGKDFTDSQQKLRASLLEAIRMVSTLSGGDNARLNTAQKSMLRSVGQKLQEVLGMMDASEVISHRT
jgi:CheY-like chemotaxis protein